MTLTEYAQRYCRERRLCQRYAGHVLAHCTEFAAFADNREPADYAADELNAWASHLEAQGTARRTVENKLGSVAAVLRAATGTASRVRPLGPIVRNRVRARVAE